MRTMSIVFILFVCLLVAAWAPLAEYLDYPQLIELPVLVGHMQGVAYLQNAMRARLMDGNPGLSAR